MPILDSYLNVFEASAIIKVHPETIKRFCRDGRLEATKVHSTWLIHISEAERFAHVYRENRGRPSKRICGDGFVDETKSNLNAGF